MMKVRIVGGGLAGVLAALEAHRLGCRSIELHERLQDLGGDDIPERPQGLELRDEFIDFGSRGGPVRQLLEWHGVAFDDAAQARQDVPHGDGFDFSGRNLMPVAPTGGSLADWLRAHPADIAGPLTRYCQWRMNAWLDEVDEGCASALGVDGRPAGVAAPTGGLAYMFSVCGRALNELGVTIHTQDLVSPWQVLQARAEDEVVVWAADPAPLAKAMGLGACRPLKTPAPTWFFRAERESAPNLRLHNFALDGSAASVTLYESRGQAVAAVECARETDEETLKRDARRLLSDHGAEDVRLEETLGVSQRPRRGHRTLAEVRRIRALRAILAQRHGSAFVTGAWGHSTPADRLAGLAAGLRAALGVEAGSLSQAA